MALTLKLRNAVPHPIDVRGLIPSAVQDLTHEEVARLPIRVGNQTQTVGDLFELHGQAKSGVMTWEGQLDSLVGLGQEMDSGQIIARGSVGPYAGCKMKAGRLEIHGSAGFGAGTSMQGGELGIVGDAGDECGALLAGERVGMRGGMITVGGNAGAHVGKNMRRGTIAVRDGCGAGVMLGAVAGTVIVAGTCGPRPGLGMRRGTLMLLGGEIPSLLPTFREGRTSRPLFWNLLREELKHLGWSMDHLRRSFDFRVFHGDLLTLGLGEIFLPVVH